MLYATSNTPLSGGGNRRQSQISTAERFPYALQYMRQVLHDGSASSLLGRYSFELGAFVFADGAICSADAFRVEIDSTSVISAETVAEGAVTVDYDDRNSTPIDKSQIHLLYWEIGFTQSAPSRVWLGHDKLDEWNNWYSTTSVNEGDVLGYGYSVLKNIMFFTRNGVLVGTSPCNTATVIPLHIPQPEFKVEYTRCARAKLTCNLGQWPFAFDIEAYCQSLFGPTRKLTSTLPPEILENILHHALDAIVRERRTHKPNKRIHALERRLAFVCRRWHTVCSRYARLALVLRSLPQYQDATTLPILWTRRELTTIDGPDEQPWSYRLLVSPLTFCLQELHTWRWCAHNRTTLDRIPPSVSHYPLLRQGCFSNLRILTLGHVSFRAWIHFVRFIFSFVQLEDLALEVSWEDGRGWDNPPKWLRFSERVKTITTAPRGLLSRVLNALPNLFFVGKLRRSKLPAECRRDLVLHPLDVAVAVRLARLLTVASRFDKICYDQVEKDRCVVRCIIGRGDVTTVVLSFERSEFESHYQLAHIEATMLNPGAHDFPERLRDLWTELSSSKQLACHLLLRNIPRPSDPVFTPEQQWDLQWRIYRAMPERYMQRGIEISVEPLQLSNPEQLDVTSACDRFCLLNAGRKYHRNDVGVVAWHLTVEEHGEFSISWLKLFAFTLPGPEDDGDEQFIADIPIQGVERHVALGIGNARFAIPNIGTGKYFLAVGRLNHRTESFEVVS